MKDSSKTACLMREQAVAEQLGVSTLTLRKWRFFGRGPGFVKIGRSVRYEPAAIDAWIAARRKGGDDRRAES